MIRLVLVASLVLLPCACRKTRNDEPPPPVEEPAAEAPAERPASCLADRLGPLSTDHGEDEDYDGARQAETDGREPEAKRLYRQSCEGGLAIGCTNYATRLIESDRECAKRLFGRACDAGEAFGCGMQGTLLLEEAETAGDVARGRALLQRTCTELGGFACSTLARRIESGQLGPADPARVKELMKRACDTGDDDACDPPPSPSPE